MNSGSPSVVRSLEADGIEVEEGRFAPVALPVDEEQVVRLLRRASADSWRVLPSGLGSKLEWCRPEATAGEFDCVLSTRMLDRVVAYVPGDGTLTAQAGCRMSDLARHVGEHGHYLTPGVPTPEKATLGGTLGAGVSGPDRIRFGPVRHHVLGMRVALADGSLANSGGRLVKNVTGFDLQRLYCGSRGTLCVQLEASLRLFPMPETEQVWRLECDSLERAVEHSRTIAALAVQPLGVLVEGDRERGSLEVHLGGHPRQLAAERELVLAQVQSTGLSILEGPEARAAREEAQAQLNGGDGASALRLTCLPTALTRALAIVGEQLDFPYRVRAQPQVACADLYFDGDSLPEAAANIEALGKVLKGEGVQLEARAVGIDVHERLAPRLERSPELDWMFRLGDSYDPKGIFASPLFPGLRGREVHS